MLTDTVTAATTAPTEASVGQCKTTVTRYELSLPSAIPTSPPARHRTTASDQELPQNIAGTRPDGHAQADLARALGHGDQHDVHDSHSAHEERNQGHAQQQVGHHPPGRSEGFGDFRQVADPEVVGRVLAESGAARGAAP